MRDLDWSTTPLGPWQAWPQSLRTAVSLMLESRHGMMLAWGPELTLLYNDTYAPFLGGRHPSAIGRPFADVRSDVWGDVAPLVDRALSGDAIWVEDYHLVMQRNGYPEDTWWQFSYSPVRDDNGRIVGVLNVTSDMTRKVLTERRQAFRISLDASLRDLTDPAQLVAATSEALGQHLRVAQVAYADVEPGGATVLIEHEWNNGAIASNAKRHRLDDFGPEFIADLRQGRTVAVADVRCDARTSSAVALATFARASILAFLDVPIMKAGKLVAIIVAHSEIPRVWSAEDIALVEEIAERTWTSAERARAEASFHDAEERYLALFNAIDQGFCTIEVAFDEHDVPVDYRFLEVSPSFERQTGIKNGSGRWMREIAADQDSHWFDIYGGVARTGEPTRFEEYSTPLDRWWDVYAFRISGPRRVAVLFRDITEQKHADAALRNSEAMLLELNNTLERQVAERTAERDRMWNTSPDLMVQASLDGVYQRANPAWRSILGYEDWEVVGQTAASFTHSADLDPMFEALDVVQANTLPGTNLRFRHKDGSYRWIQWVAAPSSGTIFALGRNVTGAIEAEAKLRQTEEVLRQSQKMEAVGQLTGGVAHDFNNLLTPILGSLDFLRRKGLGGERERRLIDGAVQSAERAKTLVQRLLSFARRQPLQTQAVDIGELVEGMKGLVASTTGPRIAIHIDIAADLPTARADPNQLEMAILNLAVNARDAMGDGGKLTISAYLAVMSEGNGSQLAPGHYVCVAIADTGTGMDKATVARSVEPFFSTKGVGQGTGLGLSMVHGLAAQLGGGIVISSHPGKGTCVQLYLPASDEPKWQARERHKDATQLAAGSVLLVDDDALVRMCTADMLADLGYAVVEAASAGEALQLAGAGQRFDILVTDHSMPGKSGTDLAHELRAQRPRLPVLIVSGHADVEGTRPRLPLLVKPFLQADLAAKLREISNTDR
jgi:PAS domain S-box-containing protein